MIIKFHDFPGQENEILEFHDFSGFPSLDKSLGQTENGLERGFAKHGLNSSLRSKRFRLVSEQRKTSPLFYSPHFPCSLWLTFLVLCSETARKCLLRMLAKLRLMTGPWCFMRRRKSK